MSTPFFHKHQPDFSRINEEHERARQNERAKEMLKFIFLACVLAGLICYLGENWS